MNVPLALDMDQVIGKTNQAIPEKINIIKVAVYEVKNLETGFIFELKFRICLPSPITNMGL